MVAVQFEDYSWRQRHAERAYYVAGTLRVPSGDPNQATTFWIVCHWLCQCSSLLADQGKNQKRAVAEPVAPKFSDGTVAAAKDFAKILRVTPDRRARQRHFCLAQGSPRILDESLVPAG